QVDAFMKKLKHPLLKVVKSLRKIILSSNKEVGEEIKWNAPSFFYSGKMRPSDPKEYKRYIVNVNLFRQDCIRLIFHTGKKLNDPSGLLLGDFKDERKMASFYSLEEVRKHEKALQKFIWDWLDMLDK
ncbi:MAG: DUF1801 domain-containing protein, partial [Chitinophagales bacterium]